MDFLFYHAVILVLNSHSIQLIRSKVVLIGWSFFSFFNCYGK